MKIYFIGAGPGDPELLTLKAVNAMKKADICIYAGSLVDRKVLKYLSKNAKVYDSSGMTLEDMQEIFNKAKKQNLDVVRLHTGDPSLYSAINEQIKMLNEMNIDYEVIPGISSFQATAAILKKELTVPGVSQTVILTRMSGRTPVPKRESMKELAKVTATMCIFLSTHMIEKLVEDLSNGYKKETPIAVVYRASRKDEIVILGTIKDIVEKVKKSGIRKTAMIIVGDVLSNELGDRSKLYDKNFTHEYRK